ncbi:4-hydroxybenzoate octaprenyltransferase [Accumulibacter sp.]|uniref:4-hydroxybenzoate octaprenyltransferase n=1 Tax=Accumulibacter sp. TaxID=2053492 RepID=UPI002626A75A|nr:4-hydroxybenzoate octaprenyltransferase [Accumulibacter sp.]
MTGMETWSRLGERIDRYEKLMRLDRPIGILLLLWPTLWALWLSARGEPNWLVAWIFVLGTVLMRSAGCVINDLADRDFDPHVARTRNRPLAAGQVSVREAWLLFGVLIVLAFLLVLLFWNWLMVGLSAAALFLAASYPFTKRFLAVPQAYLGLAFGFGIPMAYAAQLGRVPTEAWWLLLANVFWAIAYDTEYAMVDRADDLKIGIRTSAITFGQADVAAVMICYALALGLLAAIGTRIGLGGFFYGGLAGAAAIATYHYTLIRHRLPERCFKAFLHNNWLGASVFAGIAIDFSVAKGLFA